MKTLMLASILSIAVSPLAAAQSAAPARQAGKASIQRIVRGDVARIRQGVRAGQIAPAERRRLATKLRSLRGQIRSLRQAGTRPSVQERARLRAELRRLNRSIFAARHNRHIK